MKLVAPPRVAKTHIQKMAPGPPVTMAVIGPAMLPTPMRFPMLTQKTWNGVISPLALFFRENVTLHISLTWRICIPLYLIVQ